MTLKDKIANSTQKKLSYIIKTSLAYAYSKNYCNFIDFTKSPHRNFISII